jgi:misacylated tRNA(Ala) deacylase
MKEFEAYTIGLIPESNGVILDQTAFYPGGGGQPSDNGLLKGRLEYPVTKIQKTQDGILHILPPDTPLPAINEKIQGIINWERRFQLMRTHTALHILCGVVYRDYRAQVTGGDMEPLKGRMDFEFEALQKELVHEIETAVNKEVAAARPIAVQILPREEAFQIPDLIRTKINLLPEGIQQVRVVNLVGLDLQADGGTHVNNTKDVGRIRVVDYKSKGKINKRIYIELE